MSTKDRSTSAPCYFLVGKAALFGTRGQALLFEFLLFDSSSAGIFGYSVIVAAAFGCGVKGLGVCFGVLCFLSLWGGVLGISFPVSFHRTLGFVAAIRRPF